MILSINRNLNRITDPSSKETKEKIEAAENLLHLPKVPQLFIGLAHYHLCNLYTKEKAYDKVSPHCQYVVDHKSELSNAVDVADAVCNLATVLINQEEYDRAVKLLEDALRENQENKKVSLGEVE